LACQLTPSVSFCSVRYWLLLFYNFAIFHFESIDRFFAFLLFKPRFRLSAIASFIWTSVAEKDFTSLQHYFPASSFIVPRYLH